MQPVMFVTETKALRVMRVIPDLPDLKDLPGRQELRDPQGPLDRRALQVLRGR